MINNEFYDKLGSEWLERFDHPIALLRAENAARAPWIAKELEDRLREAGDRLAEKDLI